mmetsp:Transcript_43887/g.82384  ORF Transcript_43887/g.82384 Transcript_43887/m.82384 type:complete len:248 (-) Transcript_43887:83-826(-)
MEEESGPPSDNIFVTGLPEDCEESWIQPLFSAYGSVTDFKYLPGSGANRNAALVRFSSLDEAQWVVDNLNGNIPEGLGSPVAIRFATTKGRGAPPALVAYQPPQQPSRPGPYAASGKANGKGGNSKGKLCSESNIGTLITGLVQAGAVPGGTWRNDENALFIGGLPWDTTTEDLYSLFSPFGAIPAKGCKAMQSPEGHCSGIGFVNFIDSGAAQTAVVTLNGTTLPDGKVLEVKTKARRSSKGAGRG